MEKVIDNNEYEMYKLNISFKNSGHFTNAYILKDKKTNECLVVDPAFNAKYISECIEKIAGNLIAIYLTHCHGDHTAALEDLCFMNKNKEIKIYIHENDKYGILDEDKNCKYILTEPNFCDLEIDNVINVKDGDKLEIGDVILEVIHTPGHTDGCSILYEESGNILITGDTLFSDCYGRTDLNSGSINDMKQSLLNIFNRFYDTTMIFPGHGKHCTLGEAKRRIATII